MWDNLTSACHSTEGYPGKQNERDATSSEEQEILFIRANMRAFVLWPGHVWAWSSFIYSSISGALSELPRWEDEEEAQLWAAAFSQAFTPLVSLPPGFCGCRASWQPVALFFLAIPENLSSSSEGEL